MEHIEEAGIHSGDSACALPPITLGSADLLQDPRGHREAGRADRRARADERPVRDQGRHPLRDRGQPAGQSRTVPFVSKATAVQLAKAAARIAVGETIADLRAAGVLPATGDGTDLPDGRADRGQGGGAALPPVPHRRGPRRRHRARAGDEVHRRGHGPRRRVRDGVREVAGRRLRLAADRGHGVRLAGQPGQARRRSSRSSGWPTSASAVLATVGHRAGAAPQRGRSARWSASSATARATCVERILAGGRRHRRQHAVRLARATAGRGSTATRSARRPSPPASRASPPCRAWPPRCRASRRCARGDIGVRSLQEVHAALTGGRP